MVVKWILLVFLSAAIPLSLCNTCLQGTPPFQENGSQPLSSAFTEMIPSYMFTASGEITEWKLYASGYHRFRIKFQVWRPSTSMRGRSSMIGENVIRTRGPGLVIYDVPSAERIFVNEGDFVGLEVTADSGILVQISQYNSQQRKWQPAPILSAKLNDTDCSSETAFSPPPPTEPASAEPFSDTTPLDNSITSDNGPLFSTTASHGHNPTLTTNHAMPTSSSTAAVASTTATHTTATRIFINMSHTTNAASNHNDTSGVSPAIIAALIIISIANTIIVLAVLTAVGCWKAKCNKKQKEACGNNISSCNNAAAVSSPHYHNNISSCNIAAAVSSTHHRNLLGNLTTTGSPYLTDSSSTFKPQPQPAHEPEVTEDEYSYVSTGRSARAHGTTGDNYAYAISEETYRQPVPKYNMNTNPAYDV